MKYLAAFLVSILIGYFAFIYALPGFVMGKLFTSLENRGIAQHQFILSPRSTPETQTVVRPSPDLAYSICTFDFEALDGPLKIYAAPWADYASVSFFDAKTNNFATIKSGHKKEGQDNSPLHLCFSEADTAIDDCIISPTKRGVILIRRLAPTQEKWNTVKAISDQDICEAHTADG